MILLLAACGVAWRRLVGGISQPLTPASLVATGWLAAILAAMTRRLWCHNDQCHMASVAERRLVLWGPATALVMLAAALSVPGTPPGGLVVLWAVLLAEEWWSFATLRGLLEEEPARDAAVEESPAEVPDEFIRFDPPQDPEPHFPASDVTQQMTRTRAEDGAEEIRGFLRVEFAAAQRFKTTHLSFCPALADTPMLSVEQFEGPPVRIKTAQRLPHGARLELKLKSPYDEPCDVVLEYVVRASHATA
jgi:hypothetical protein